jgi:hypothetical protein
MEAMFSLGVVAAAVVGGWVWEIVTHREPARLDRRIRAQLQQSADTIRDSTLG